MLVGRSWRGVDARAYIGQAYAWMRSPEMRLRSARDRRVRKLQRAKLPRTYDRAAEQLIVFIVPGANPATGAEFPWGGIMSICAICDETASLHGLHKSEVMLCTLPGGTPLLRHTLFPSSTDVFRLEQVFDYFRNLRRLTLHVPEYVAGRFVSMLSARDLHRLTAIEFVHVNVMNQNVELMPSSEELDSLRSIASLVTMTTAHERYGTEELSRRLSLPVHHLSVRIGAEQYRLCSFADKNDLVVFSPDDRAKNDEVARLLARRFHRLETVVIDGVPYADYRRLLERAKWTFTFGEGLDYYFVESVFSGGISFAVFNDTFFTPAFRALETVYSSFDELCARVCADVERLSEPNAYREYQRRQFELVSEIYSLRRFRDNLSRFLRDEYTWPAESRARDVEP